MGEVEQASQAIATSRGSAAGRLRKLLTTVNEMNSARYVGDSKMHDMVAVAMEENWDVCKAHMEFITGLIADVRIRRCQQTNSMCLTPAPPPCAPVQQWFAFSTLN